MDENRTKKLMMLMRDAGLDRESAVTISLRVRRPQHQAAMIEWLEQNPQAEPLEIVLKSREIVGRRK